MNDQNKPEEQEIRTIVGRDAKGVERTLEIEMLKYEFPERNGTMSLQVARVLPEKRGVVLEEECNFKGWTFEEDADFSNLTFRGAAIFKKATFQGKANFSGAHFKAQVNFVEGVFEKDVSFREAQFLEEDSTGKNEYVSFIKCEFGIARERG